MRAKGLRLWGSLKLVWERHCISAVHFCLLHFQAAAGSKNARHEQEKERERERERERGQKMVQIGRRRRSGQSHKRLNKFGGFDSYKGLLLFLKWSSLATLNLLTVSVKPSYFQAGQEKVENWTLFLRNRFCVILETWRRSWAKFSNFFLFSVYFDVDRRISESFIVSSIFF